MLKKLTLPLVLIIALFNPWTGGRIARSLPDGVEIELFPPWWSASLPDDSRARRQWAGGTSVAAALVSNAHITVTPRSLHVEARIPQTVTRYLTITHDASAALHYRIEEVPPTTGASHSLLLQSESAGANGPRVEPVLQAAIERGAEVGYMLSFHQRADLSPAYSMAWGARGRFVLDALQENARVTQARVRAYLDRQGVTYQAFWINNAIIIDGSSRAVFEGLKEFSEIEALTVQRSLYLVEPSPSPLSPTAPAVEANLVHVQADRVWDELHVTGAHIVVANIDTGVRYSHQALAARYRGNRGDGAFEHAYNWLDPASGNSAPADEHGHGSHTMGIMVGDDGGANRVGMAPGAQWIACDACNSNACPDAAILTCAEWVIAPYPSDDPNAANADLRPHIINNSWGDCSTAYDPWFQDVIDAWHAAGLYPVFANGNVDVAPCPTTPACGTAGNPARYGNVTAVGSTGKSDGQIAGHSLWGPTDNLDTVNPRGYPDLKPQVVAPGVSIRSTYHTGDDAYTGMSGTSMSTPHVAGLIALMWQAAPCLVGDYIATETLIEQTAAPITYATHCGGEGPGDTPNYAAGWGEIDAYAAVRAAISHCDVDWLPWAAVEPLSGTLASGEQHVATVTFTCNQTTAQQTQPFRGALRIQPDDPDIPPQTVDLIFYCSGSHPLPWWEKEVFIGDQLVQPASGPHIVRPGERITVVDRVGAVYHAPFDALLSDTWTSALSLIHYETDGAGLVMPAEGNTLSPPAEGGLVWRLTDAEPNTLHYLTKTFEAAYRDWSTAVISERYTVYTASEQLTDRIVSLHPYQPAVQLQKTGPLTVSDGDMMPITLTINSQREIYHIATLTDVLPPGMQYAGSLTATYGQTRHGDGVIHWSSYGGAPVVSATLENVVKDSGFEEGTPNPHWEESSTNFGTPICDESSCGLGGGSGPRTGDWWVWFGGIDDAYEAGSMAQDLFIAPGEAVLSFWLEISSADGAGNLTVSIDEHAIFSTTEADVDIYPVYQPITLDVSQFADGYTHTLRFDSVTEAGGVTSFLVDDVALHAASPLSLPFPITLTFDVAVFGEVGDIIRNTAILDWRIDYTTAVHDVTVLPDDDTANLSWEKRVHVNGEKKTGGAIPLTSNDVVQVVDSVRISDADHITFTLVEAWSAGLASLTRTATASPGGTLLVPGDTLIFPYDLVTAGDTLTWRVAQAPAEWTYVLTQTFALLSDTWGAEYITATLYSGDRLYDSVVLRFLSGVEGRCYLPLVMRDSGVVRKD